VVVFIHRTEEDGLTELLVSKQRDGPTGIVKVAWTAECVRFDNLPVE